MHDVGIILPLLVAFAGRQYVCVLCAKHCHYVKKPKHEHPAVKISLPSAKLGGRPRAVCKLVHAKFFHAFPVYSKLFARFPERALRFFPAHEIRNFHSFAAYHIIPQCASAFSAFASLRFASLSTVYLSRTAFAEASALTIMSFPMPSAFALTGSPMSDMNFFIAFQSPPCK